MEQKELQELCKNKPDGFIHISFNESLWNYQRDIVYSVRDNKVTAVKSCNGIGKSYIAARLALWFLYTYPDSKVITTAPTAKQVRDVLWREIRSAKSKAVLPLSGQLNQMSLDLSEEWFALGLSTDKPDRFQGFHAEHILLIVDEAAGVDEDIFVASDGIVTSQGAKVLYIGNPTNTAGTFYNSFRLEGVSKITVSAFDTPNFVKFGITLDDIRNGTWQEKITGELPAPYLITPEWVADKYKKWGENTPMWSARVMGEFPQQGDNTLIPLYKIELARNANIQILDTDPEVIGADFARFGTDKTEYCYRKGSAVLDWKTLTKIDTVVNAGELGLFMNFHPGASVNADEGGLGVGIVDMVKQNNPIKTVNGVNSSSEPDDKESFANLRAEMFWALRDRFMNGDMDLSKLPQDVYDDLSAQLSNINYKFTPRGQRLIESKEEMKNRGVQSPDKADSLCLAFGNAQSNKSANSFLEGLKGWSTPYFGGIHA
jgi:hypothetical protein